MRTTLACTLLLTLAAAPSTAEPFASTYRPLASDATLISDVVLLDGAGGRLDGASILLRDGRVAAIGPGLDVPEDAEEVTVVDGTGLWVTPGIIDVHSHLGVYPSPGVSSTSDGNEATDPVTAQVWAEHSVWPQDPGFTRALAGGITSLLVLPGSANLIGGRGVVLKNVPARTVQEMKFPGAPHALKMACGENPKRFYGQNRQRAPSTRMGNVAGYRAAWIEATEYRAAWARYEKQLADGEENPKVPERDLAMETLVGVLDGEILVHNHCYRADEMATMLEIADEFGYRVTAFHHAIEAYKIADVLAENDVCAAMWADWWGFKLEAWDMIRENVALVDLAGGCAIVHSDSERDIQRLNQEAAKVLAAARRIGLEVGPENAIRWITSQPARAMGILDETGTLEPGKAADVVLWNRDPFSVYAHAQMVWIDGALVYDRADPDSAPVTDFELGLNLGDAR